MARISSINARKSRRRVAASSVVHAEPPPPQSAVTEAVEATQGRRRGEWSYRDGPGEGITVDRLFVKGRQRTLPGSTSENLIEFESVSAPLGRASVGLVGDGGEKMGGKGVGGGLDAGFTPALLMVDETRRAVRPLANN